MQAGLAWAGAFEDGVALYRSGDYAAALREFERARGAGDDNPNLRFNIALTLYRLDRLDQSRRELEALRREPRYAAIADYHLGLIAAGRGDRASASESLRRAAQGTDSDALRRLASVALSRVDGTRRGGAKYLALGAGYDDNASLLDDELQPAASAGDGLVELLGAVERPFRSAGAPANFWLAGLHARQYGDTPEFDQQSGQLAVRHERAALSWRASLGGRFDISFIGGDLLQNAGTVVVEGRHAIGRGTGAARLAGSRIEGGDDHAELTGWRERLTLEWITGLATTGYELELNDRADLAAGPEFASRSPLRHQLATRLSTPLGRRNALEWAGRWRFSDYRGEDRYFDAGALVQRRREDRLAEAAVGWRYRLGGPWSTLLEGRYTSNRSSIDRYAYEKAVALLALEWTR